METNQKMSIVQKIEQTSPAQLATIPEVADRFKHIYKVMNGGRTDTAEVKYEAEKFHFMKLIQDTPALQQCTKLSLYGCFLDMAVNGLSFDRSMKHAYVVSFNTNVGTKDAPKWEKRATLMISGYGELHMRVKQGQIKHADNPVIVYEGDQFKHGTKDGSVFLEHVATLPRKSDKIIGCYLRIERNDGSVDYKVLGIEEVMKFRDFSKDKNSLAWTSGLPGMVQAKTMKHAFRSYPKVRMGKFTQLQSQIVDADSQAAQFIDYGLNGDMPAVKTVNTPHEIIADPVTDQANDRRPVENISDDAFVVDSDEKAESKGKVFTDDDF